MIRAMIAAMAEIYLALGSNVGDGPATFHKTIMLLGNHLQNIVQAPRYTSLAVGYTDQPDFLNTALRATTVFSPLALLEFVKQTEAAVGRIERFRWGPREIDIDIIFYDQLVMDEPALTLPHPRFRDRDFVLLPLLDIDPTLVDPVSHEPLLAMYQQLSPAERVSKILPV